MWLFFSVSVGTRNGILGFGGVFVLVVLAGVAYSTKQGRASDASNPSQAAASTYGSIEVLTPRVEYQKVSTTSDNELPL